VTGPFTDTKRQPFTPADFRFISKGDTLYAVALAWPGDGKWIIRALAAGSLPREIRRVELLGSEAALKWNRDSKGLIIEAPPQKPGEHAYVLKITAG
jgi:alpha-L-fucosidase